MSIKRFLKKALIPGYSSISILKKVKQDGYINGIKGQFKEDMEDTPIISQVYSTGKQDGKIEGKKEGYVEASYEYEKKLIKQAEKFENKKKISEDIIEGYKNLLTKYEKYITEQEQKIESLSKEKILYLNIIKEKYHTLQNMK